MRPLSATLLASAFLFLRAGALRADDISKPKPNQIGVEPVIAMPVGDFGDGAGIGFGGLARYQRQLFPKLRITGRAGFLYHLEKNDVSIYEVPFVAGIKYDFKQDGDTRIYAGSELGFCLVGAKVMGSSDSNTNLAMSGGVGYERGKLDLRAQIWLPDVGDAMAIMATVGYAVTAF